MRLWPYEWLLDRKNKYTGVSNLLKELEKEQPNEFINYYSRNICVYLYQTNFILI